MNSETEIIDESSLESAEDYKVFFLKKFHTSMKDLLSFLLLQFDESSVINQKLTKINNILTNKSVDYRKLINKLCGNEKIMINLTILKESNINETVLEELLKKGEKKDWILIPEFHVDKIIRGLSDKQSIIRLIDDIKNIYVCAESYKGIEDMLTEQDEDSEFNPVEKIMSSRDPNDININSMFKDVKYKQMTSYEMLIKMMVDEKTESKVGEYMNNIKEDDVNEAASKLDDVLKNTESNDNASRLLGTMLSNIKDEVIEMGNNPNQNLDGKDALQGLMSIAKKVAGGMTDEVKQSGLSPIEIWEATSSLARKTVKSDALDIVDGIIKQNIYSGMNNNQGMNMNMNGDSQVEELGNNINSLNFDDDVE